MSINDFDGDLSLNSYPANETAQAEVQQNRSISPVKLFALAQEKNISLGVLQYMIGLPKLMKDLDKAYASGDRIAFEILSSELCSIAESYANFQKNLDEKYEFD